MSSKRILWLLAAAALAVALLLWRTSQPARQAAVPSTAPADVAKPTVTALPAVMAPTEPPPAAPPTLAATAAAPASEPPRPLPPGVISIRDRKTLDFSNGKAVVKDDAAEKAAIEAALKEIDEATKGVTFGPNSGPAMAP